MNRILTLALLLVFGLAGSVAAQPPPDPLPPRDPFWDEGSYAAFVPSISRFAEASKGQQAVAHEEIKDESKGADGSYRRTYTRKSTVSTGPQWKPELKPPCTCDKPIFCRWVDDCHTAFVDTKGRTWSRGQAAPQTTVRIYNNYTSPVYLSPYRYYYGGYYYGY